MRNAPPYQRFYQRLSDEESATLPSSQAVPRAQVPAERTLRVVPSPSPGAWTPIGWWMADATGVTLAGDGLSLYQYDLTQKRGPRLMVELQFAIRSTAVAPDGAVCVVGGQGGLLGVYDLRSSASPLPCLWEAEGHDETVAFSGIAFSPSGDRFVASAFSEVRDEESFLYLHETFSRSPITALRYEGRHHPNWGRVDFSKEHVCTVNTGSQKVQVWKAAAPFEQVCNREYGEGHVMCARFSPSGHRLAVLISRREPQIILQVLLLDATRSFDVHDVITLPEQREGSGFLEFSHGGGMLVAGISVWALIDTTTNAIVGSHAYAGAAGGSIAHFSPNDDMLYLGGGHGPMPAKLLELKPPEVAEVYQSQSTSSVEEVCSGATYVALRVSESLWEIVPRGAGLATDPPVQLDIGERSSCALANSRPMRRVALWARSVAHVFSFPDGKKVLEVQAPRTGFKLSWSPDDRHLVAVGGFGGRVFNSESGQKLYDFTDNNGDVVPTHTQHALASH